MSWRVVVVSSSAKLDFKMDYLVVRMLEETRRIHISEIGVLMVESTAVSITAYALCELLARKVKVIFCDRQRNPCGELIPCSGSHDSTARIRQQIIWTAAAREGVWTEIVREKIRRQRDVLLRWQRPQAELLTRSGFLMMQESVYCKLTLNMSAAGAVMESVRQNKPPEGLVQMLVVTEKQFARMEFVVGESHSEIIDSDERTIFL